MRSARDFAVGGARPYYSPDRPRVADPDQRGRIAGYLSGGTQVGPVRAGHAWHTDGVWVWPSRFIREIRDRGLAPEPDFLRYMRRCDFTAATPVCDEHLQREVRAAALAGPPKRSEPVVVYFVRVEDDFPPDAPVSLLRRVRGGDGRFIDEALWRDLAWHPTHAFASHADEYDLREVTEAHAAAVIDRWCAKWHTEWHR